ncbi:CidA/LrgA family protein [Enterovibrio norvegicus]|uniref:Antiholin LrgA n=1 Tax=Enterovibrio norvegicus TaxID=188144 RepID=A0A2N7L3Y5_9GAMM|nr:CidA/LrgA family protein [Enterovibrio norvegicus]PML77012.1 antiholin LrgA [Enterovibrio norvegicus]PMN62875.1 antiholin LrgA [Enterovibrio norvegicus]PMN88098.1 antiholin LrgA [Enterovibrio norvegicus]
MKYVLGFALIAFFYFLGYFLAQLIPLPIPSSIISMLLLFLCLTTGIVPARWVKDACTLLITFMPLFFIPASMGLMDHFDLLFSQSLPLLGSTLVSSLVVLIVMAKVIDKHQGESK